MNATYPNRWVYTDSSLRFTKRKNVIKVVSSQKNRKKGKEIEEGKKIVF